MLNERMKKKLILALISLLYSTGLIFLVCIGYYKTQNLAGFETINRIFTLMGGNILAGGYIQFLTYFAFFWCLLEIKDQLKFIRKEKRTLNIQRPAWKVE